MSDVTNENEATATSPEPTPVSGTADTVTAKPGKVPTEESGRTARKVREGLVVSAGMNKTAVVAVTERVRHRRYGKTVLRSKKLYVHDEVNDAGVGDRVRVAETRPLSKLKRWRLVEVLERAK